MILYIQSTQAQRAFGKVIDQASAGSNGIVERYGSPRLAIISYRRYQQLLEAERQLLRHRLQSASEEGSRQAVQLSEIEIDELIESARQEVTPFDREH